MAQTLDLGAEAHHEMLVESPDQAPCAGHADRLVGRQPLERADGRADAEMIEDQLEASAGVDALVEGHLDDMPDALVALAGREAIEGGDDRFLLADGPEIRPGRDDVALRKELPADMADGLDVPLLV